MKKLRFMMAASVLALSISITAVAGDMPGAGYYNPPPSPAANLAPEPTETAVPQQSAADSITELAIEMGQLFFSIF